MNKLGVNVLWPIPRLCGGGGAWAGPEYYLGDTACSNPQFAQWSIKVVHHSALLNPWVAPTGAHLPNTINSCRLTIRCCHIAAGENFGMKSTVAPTACAQ
jgi:hypothetical protein